ncbi:MAG: hypothetical protein KF764_01720 [Labilithrix sp.]|nr:hypothetical protein [Labilithrix sp.]
MKLATAWARAKAVRSETLVRVACVLGLVALPLMVLSVFVPTVWPVLVALSFGQALGTLSFLLYLVAIARDLEIARRLRTPRREDVSRRSDR